MAKSASGGDEGNPAFWLGVWAGRMGPPGFPALVSHLSANQRALSILVIL